MKKIIAYVCSAFMVYSATAQTSGAVLTTIPANFTALDQVKVIVDVSSVGNLRDKGPLYVWTWNPNEAYPGNGQWGNSNEARKMVQEGPNKWSWTFTPAEYYGTYDANGVLKEALAPSKITKINFLVKAKSGDGDLKTDDLTLTVAPLVFVETDFRVFPATVGQNEVMSAYFNQNLVTDENSKRMSPVSAEISIYNEAGAKVGATIIKTLTKVGDKLFAARVFPKGDFNIAAGVKIIKMKVVFKGTVLDVNGNPATVSSVEYEKLFDELK
jgi:hypothetical protein